MKIVFHEPLLQKYNKKYSGKNRFDDTKIYVKKNDDKSSVQIEKKIPLSVIKRSLYVATSFLYLLNNNLENLYYINITLWLKVILLEWYLRKNVHIF